MTFTQMKAIEKIRRECEQYKGDRRGQIVARPVADTLVQFCEASTDFAEAVADEDKTFTDCIAAVVRDVGSALADIEAFRRAVGYFFPDADIKVDMRIILPGVPDVDSDVETVENPSDSGQAAANQGAGESGAEKIISFFDIL